MNKKVVIKLLRTFFSISNEIFDIEKIVQLHLNGIIIPKKMQYLHKLAMEELEKENPDLEIIDKLLAEMENLAK